MEDILKADIFFFIASIATVVFTVLASILFYYLIRASRNLYEITEIFKGGVRESEQFLEDLWDRLDSNFLFRMIFPSPRKKRRTAAKDDTIRE